MQDVIKFINDKFTSISMYDWKLRYNHTVAIETQYVTTETLPIEGQEIALHVGNDTCNSESGSDNSEDGASGAGKHGAQLHSISRLFPLNMNSDINY
jgi:hypothetical protein